MSDNIGLLSWIFLSDQVRKIRLIAVWQ